MMAMPRNHLLPKTDYKGRPAYGCDNLCPCRPCWAPHDCYPLGRPDLSPRMACAMNHNHGCPNPVPEAMHVTGKGRGYCKRCRSKTVKPGDPNTIPFAELSDNALRGMGNR